MVAGSMADPAGAVAGQMGLAISKYSGNTTTDQQYGKNQLQNNYVAGVDTFMTLPQIHFSLTTVTTIYLKALYVPASTPTVNCYIVATRIR